MLGGQHRHHAVHVAAWLAPRRPEVHDGALGMRWRRFFCCRQKLQNSFAVDRARGPSFRGRRGNSSQREGPSHPGLARRSRVVSRAAKLAQRRKLRPHLSRRPAPEYRAENAGRRTTTLWRPRVIRANAFPPAMATGAGAPPPVGEGDNAAADASIVGEGDYVARVDVDLWDKPDKSSGCARGGSFSGPRGRKRPRRAAKRRDGRHRLSHPPSRIPLFS